MRTKAIIAAALLATAGTAAAAPVATTYICNDGTFIHLNEQNGRLTASWRGADIPVTKIETGKLTASLNGEQGSSTPQLVVGYNTTPNPIAMITTIVNGSMNSQSCKPDTASKHIDL